MLRNWFRSLWRPWRSRSSFVQQEELSGLGAPVEVKISTAGVCHLFAKTELDLFRAQGFVTARDRLFQMDTARRAASGRLAQWYGDVPALGVDPVLHLRGQGLASVDYLMRIFGLQQAAEDGISWLSPRSYRALLAYAEGINEWIALAKKQNRLSVGYGILDTAPEEWKPTDSLLLLRLLAFRLSFPWRLLLSFGALCFHMPDQKERLASLLPPHLDFSLSQLDELKPFFAQHGGENADQGFEQAGISGTYNAYTGADGLDPLGTRGTGQGSCAWVVSGSLTRSGQPILCNDPHLALRLPAAFYQIRLHGGPYDVVGLSIPGHPGIYAGHNEQIAWGASLSRVDDADIFLEELDPVAEKYRNKERMLPLIRREEVIQVRAETPRHRWVRSTLRGPLLSDALRGPLPAGLAYSLAWTGHEGVRETETILQLNRAADWGQFRQALQSARCPSLGFVYADRKGNIGGMIAGRCPQRSCTPRAFHPLPGADGRYDWGSDIPFEELPYAYNPTQGYLILSGQRPGAPMSEHALQGMWETNYRAERIEELLQKRLEEQPTAEHMGRLQRDHYSLWSRNWIIRHLKPYAEGAKLSPPVAERLRMLLEWNGRTGPDSLAATYFAMFQQKLAEQAYQPILGKDLFRRWSEIAHELESPLEPMMRAEDQWLERGRDAAFHFALTQAYHGLQKKLGQDPEQWTWKRLHRLHLKPIFYWDSHLLGSFIRGPYGTGGDAYSINAGTHSWTRPFEHRVGATARQTFDLAHWDQSQWIICGGQSEHPHSPHYDDQIAHWLRGDALPMAFHPSALQNTPTQWLQPPTVAKSPMSYLEALTSPFVSQQANVNPEDSDSEEK